MPRPDPRSTRRLVRAAPGRHAGWHRTAPRTRHRVGHRDTEPYGSVCTRRSSDARVRSRMAHGDPAAAIAHLAARGPAGASTVRLDQQEAPRNRHQTAEATAGSGPPLHVHRDFAESFFVLAGRYGM